MSKANKNIICGDFNVVERSFIKPFSWLMGSSIKEVIFYPERRNLKNLFEEYKLKNPLSKKRTHKLFNIQLDHILVPKNVKILSKKVNT